MAATTDLGIPRPSICLLANEPGNVAEIESILARCGISVWNCSSALAFVLSPKQDETLCVVVSMPGATALSVLETLRMSAVRTPAILIVDHAVPLPTDRLARACPLDVLVRPVSVRELLAWIECLCVAQRHMDQTAGRSPPLPRAA
jgi:FixJ family two-component response regulator